VGPSGAKPGGGWGGAVAIKVLEDNEGEMLAGNGKRKGIITQILINMMTKV